MVKVGSNCNSCNRFNEKQEENDVRCKFNFNHFNFQNTPLIVLCKFCARPAWYSKNEGRGQWFDWFHGWFFSLLCLVRIKQKPFVMTEGCLHEFCRTTEKSEKLLYLNQASRIITSGCFWFLFLYELWKFMYSATCSKFFKAESVTAFGPLSNPWCSRKLS